MEKFEMTGICVATSSIEKGSLHYSPWTEVKKDEELTYKREYSEYQEKYGVDEDEIPDIVHLYDNKGEFVFETNDVYFDMVFKVLS